MTDLTPFTAAKSDQMNADDLIAGPRTIKVANVRGVGGDQPVIINYEGDNGKPFKPCKSMIRVLCAVWGADGSAYAGRSMTLYNDPEVAFGGIKTGGIRISHMSELNEPMTMSLTKTRGKKAPYSVKPLMTNDSNRPDRTSEYQSEARMAAEKGTASFTAWYTNKSDPDLFYKQEAAKMIVDDLKATAAKADAMNEDDPFADMTGSDTSSTDQDSAPEENTGDDGPEPVDAEALIKSVNEKLTASIDEDDIKALITDKLGGQIEALRAQDQEAAARIDVMIEARIKEFG